MPCQKRHHGPAGLGNLKAAIASWFAWFRAGTNRVGANRIIGLSRRSQEHPLGPSKDIKAALGRG